MKIKLFMVSLLVFMCCISQVFAGEGHDHGEDNGSMMEEKEAMRESLKLSEGAVNVGNKICPVSGEVIAEMGDGKGIQFEHNGKIYNFCCSMCVKDFKKNPEKFIEKINEELESSE